MSAVKYQDYRDALRYAERVVSGIEITGKWTKVACQRHLDDLGRVKDKSFQYRFDRKLADKACWWIQKLKHIKGIWANSTIVLEPWQKFIICMIFGWVWKHDGYRRFREVYVEVARKNGKSMLAACIGLYMLTEDNEPGAEVYSGATTEKQAWEVFRPARLMARKDPAFCEHYGLTVNAESLACIEAASKFEPVIGTPGDGPSPHCAIVDEFHEHKDAGQYNAHITGMGARTQPLLLIITTAGSNLAGPCYDKRDQVVKVLSGVFDNDEIFGIIYTLDDAEKDESGAILKPEDDWTDFNLWKKANPNLGVSVFEYYLLARRKEAIQRASRQNIIRCKHLNQWMNAATAWMNMVAWRKCTDSNIKPGDFKGKPCWMALDLASKVDLAELVRLFKWQDDKGNDHFAAFCNHYLPEEAAESEDKSNYAGWAREGWITLTPGNVLDYGYIKDDMRDYKSEFEIQEVPFDPFQATQLSVEMLSEGFPMVEFGSTVKNFSQPMKEFEGLVLSGRFHHNGDPVLTWMISNVLARIDKKDNIFPQKQREENKIDGAVAIIMAIGRAMLSEDTRSIYETQRMTIF